MKKEADRIKRWRAKQKAEGKTSFTVLLSQEARDILTEEKERTGESYAVIVDRALDQLKRTGYRPPKLHPLPRLGENVAHAHGTHTQSATGSAKKKPVTVRTGILIDDLANEPLPDHSAGNVSGVGSHGTHDLRDNESLITRILRSSTGPFGRKKTWFK